MRLSSSTSGPHQASRTRCARAISGRQLVEREAGDSQRFVPGQGAALVEQGAFGGGERHGISLDSVSLSLGPPGTGRAAYRPPLA